MRRHDAQERPGCLAVVTVPLLGPALVLAGIGVAGVVIGLVSPGTVLPSLKSPPASLAVMIYGMLVVVGLSTANWLWTRACGGDVDLGMLVAQWIGGGMLVLVGGGLVQGISSGVFDRRSPAVYHSNEMECHYDSTKTLLGFRRGGVELVSPRYTNICKRDCNGEVRWLIRDKAWKWGVADPDGNELCAPVYDLTGHTYYKGLLAVYKDGKAGFLDASGTLVIPCRYHPVGGVEFANGRILAREDGTNNHVFLDAKGAQSQPLASVHSRRNGQLLIGMSDGRWGAWKENGEVVASPTWDAIELLEPGLLHVKRGGLSGLLDLQGQVVIEASFQEIAGGDGDLLRARRDGRWGLLDRRGKWRLEPCCEEMTADGSGLWRARRNGRWGLLREDGGWALPPECEAIEATHGDVRPVKLNGVWGLYEADGTPRVKPRYRWLRAMGRSTFAVTLGDGWGLIDGRGRELQPLRFSDLESAGQDAQGQEVIKVCAGGRWGLIAGNGAQVAPLLYVELRRFEGAMCAARLETGWGFLDSEGALVVAARFEEVGTFASGWAPVCLKGRWGMVGRDGRLILECRYDDVVPLAGGEQARVRLGQEEFLVGDDGKRIYAEVPHQAEAPLH